MTEAEFNQTLGLLQAQDDRNANFVWVVNQMVRLLNECDHEDFFGTEGWRHYFGWDE